MATELYLPLHTDLTDLSPYGRNGTANGATFSANQGKRKGCYYFNNATNNRIYTSSFVYSNPNQITYSFWSKSVQSARVATALNRALSSPSSPHIRISRYTNQDNLYVYFATGATTQAYGATGYFTGFDNKWIHTTVTVDCVIGQITIYRNGQVFRQSATGLTILPITASNTVVVGCYQASAASWAGSLCEVKITVGIQNPAQVKDEYMLLAGHFNN